MATPTPAQAEATGTPIRFEYDGETYEVAPSSTWDLDILEAYEDGMIVRVIKGLLGPKQYAQFRSKKRTAADVGGLFESMQVAMGLGGNS